MVTGEVIKLCKSYRSTYEITAIAQRIRANNELEPVARHGETPQVLPFDTRQAEINGIVSLLAVFRKSGYRSLGIICKTETQARELAEELEARTGGICFLSNRSAAFVNGIIVTSAHMAKGLEFDEVIVPHADSGMPAGFIREL